MARWGVVFDQAKCIGCNACQVSCKDYHSLESGKNFRRAETVEYEADGVKKYAHFSGSCHHCTDADCVKACPFGAMKVAEEGAVVVDAELCKGCGACERACRYGAVYVSAKSHVAMKCDLCAERRKEGKLPVCVEACRTFALEWKELDEEPVISPLAARLNAEFKVNLNDTVKVGTKAKTDASKADAAFLVFSADEGEKFGQTLLRNAEFF